MTGWNAAGLESRLTAMRAVLHQLAENPSLTARAVIERFRDLPGAAQSPRSGLGVLDEARAGLRSWVSARSGIHAPRSARRASCRRGRRAPAGHGQCSGASDRRSHRTPSPRRRTRARAVLFAARADGRRPCPGRGHPLGRHHLPPRRNRRPGLHASPSGRAPAPRRRRGTRQAARRPAAERARQSGRPWASPHGLPRHDGFTGTHRRPTSSSRQKPSPRRPSGPSPLSTSRGGSQKEAAGQDAGGGPAPRKWRRTGNDTRNNHPDPFEDVLQQGVQRAIQLASGCRDRRPRCTYSTGTPRPEPSTNATTAPAGHCTPRCAPSSRQAAPAGRPPSTRHGCARPPCCRSPAPGARQCPTPIGPFPGTSPQPPPPCASARKGSVTCIPTPWAATTGCAPTGSGLPRRCRRPRHCSRVRPGRTTRHPRPGRC